MAQMLWRDANEDQAETKTARGRRPVNTVAARVAVWRALWLASTAQAACLA